MIEAGASLAYGVFFAAGPAFLLVVLRRLGATADVLALYITLTYVGSIVASLSVVALRHWRPLRLSIFCWAIGRAMFLPMALVTGPEAMLVLMTLFWVAESFPAPAYARLMQSLYPVEYRGRAMAAVRLGMVLAVIVATPLAGWMLDAAGHRTLLPLAGIIGVVAALGFSRLRVPDEAPAAVAVTQAVSPLGILRRNPRFSVYLLGLTLFGFGNIIGAPLYPLVQVDRLELSYTQIGYLTLAQSLCWLLGFLAWGRLVDRHSAMRVMVFSAVFAALVPWTYIWAESFWTLLPAFIAQGFVQAGFDVGVTNVGIELAEPGRVVEYSALQNLVVGMRGLVAPMLGAGLLASGMPDRTIFAIGSLLVVMSCLTFWLTTSIARQPVAASAPTRTSRE
jgi:MFS family permease